MNYYLLVYDRKSGQILERHDYGETARDAALADRRALTMARRLQPDVEVVLLGADTYEDLMNTHSRYFKTADQILDDAAAIRR